MVWNWTYEVLHKIWYSRGLYKPDPNSDSADNHVLRKGTVGPAVNARTCTIQVFTKSGKFSLNRCSLILLSQFSIGSLLSAALERLAENKTHPMAIWHRPGLQRSRWHAMLWHPPPPHTEVLHNHTTLLQTPTEERGKGKNKNREDGGENETKKQRGIILWKIMKWDSEAFV